MNLNGYQILSPDSLKNLKNHIETIGIFTHNKRNHRWNKQIKGSCKKQYPNNKPISLTNEQFELIRQPNEIRLSTNIPPKGYMATGLGYQRLDKEYEAN